MTRISLPDAPAQPTAPPGAPQAAAPDARQELMRSLYETYGASVAGRCRYLLRDRTRAEDAMHDVFAKAIEHQMRFRAEASPLTWLLKMATNHCLNLLRSDHAAWRERFATGEQERSAARNGADDAEARDLVRRALELFADDPETQAAAVHYHVDEMTLDEVAALLGRSVPTIRKRLEDFAAACRSAYPASQDKELS